MAKVSQYPLKVHAKSHANGWMQARGRKCKARQGRRMQQGSDRDRGSSKPTKSGERTTDAVACMHAQARQQLQRLEHYLVEWYSGTNCLSGIRLHTPSNLPKWFLKSRQLLFIRDQGMQSLSCRTRLFGGWRQGSVPW